MTPHYDYIVIDAEICYAMFAHDAEENPDAYLASDQPARLLEKAICQGYRWVRTEDSKAIWEKQK